MIPYYTEWAAQARSAYGLPVHFRMHPKAAEKGYRQSVRGTVRSLGNLENALSSAHVAVCWNSNSAVDAVLAGVPAVTMDRGSMAWDVTSHAVGEIIRPDRESWAAQLAWRQWRLDEIASGAAVERLFEGVSHV